MNPNDIYTVNLTFKNQRYEIGIIPHRKRENFDLHIKTNKALSGEDFQALKSYLIEEGYVSQAYEWHSHISI